MLPCCTESTRPPGPLPAGAATESVFLKNLNIGQPVIPPALHLMNQQQPRQEPLNHPSKKNVEVFCQFKKPTYDLLFDWEELDIIEPAEISFEDPQSSC